MALKGKREAYMKREESYRGRHAASPQGSGTPPWLVPPAKRPMPKLVKKLLVAACVLAFAALCVYLYYLLNPAVGRVVEYK